MKIYPTYAYTYTPLLYTEILCICVLCINIVYPSYTKKHLYFFLSFSLPHTFFSLAQIDTYMFSKLCTYEFLPPHYTLTPILCMLSYFNPRL